MNSRKQVVKYLLFDFISAILSWGLFFAFRKVYIESYVYQVNVPIEFTSRFYLGLIIIPVFWLGFYYAAGHYKDVFKKSRLTEFMQTFLVVLIGVTLIFFVAILDDTIQTYTDYYTSYFTLFGAHFILTYIPRLIITSGTIRRVQNRKIGFNTLIIGASDNASEVYDEIENLPKSTGNKIVGFVTVKNGFDSALSKRIPHMGEMKDIAEVITKHKIEEVIIAIESNEHDQIGEIISQLELLHVTIKAIPDMYDILTGHVKMSSIFGAPLIEITDKLMPQWQFAIKQFMDVVVSSLALIISSPILIIIAIIVKISSKGPIIYMHERIGKHGKPFKIYKFRTMFVNAEDAGPQLSSKNDNRITRIGKFLRKTRLDEFPNFVNVLKGDMSLVGPRPERQFYIDKIVEQVPHYYQLQKVKPGITSLGQVRFGYAENVDQMVQRLRYDLLYIKNMSLYIDLQILIYTVVTVLKGKGQ